MTAATADLHASDEVQLATFYVGQLLLALPIESVQEINRNLETTTIPNAPDDVLGVINLRGEVTTVIDLRSALGLPSAEITSSSRNVIARVRGEQVGFCVDRIADIITVKSGEIVDPPANMSGVDSEHFSGVYELENDVVVVLKVDAVLSQS